MPRPLDPGVHAEEVGVEVAAVVVLVVVTEEVVALLDFVVVLLTVVLDGGALGPLHLRIHVLMICIKKLNIDLLPFR